MLSSYIEEFKKLAKALISGQTVESGPLPPDFLDKQVNLLQPIVLYGTPFEVNFGDVCSDIPQNSTFKSGNNVTVLFWSACLQNDLKTEHTFALVEFLKGKDKWSGRLKLSPTSKATMEWRIPQGDAFALRRNTPLPLSIICLLYISLFALHMHS